MNIWEALHSIDKKKKQESIRSTSPVDCGAVEYTDSVRLHPNKYPGYDTKQYDGEASVMLELWEMQSISLLPSLPARIWPAVVASDRTLSMDQI